MVFIAPHLYCIIVRDKALALGFKGYMYATSMVGDLGLYLMSLALLTISSS